MSNKADKFIALGALFILSLCLDGVLFIVDGKDTPVKAAVEFSEAYFAFDADMAARMSAESLEKYSVADYLAEAQYSADESGFGMYYLKNKLYAVETHLSLDGDKGVVKLDFERKAPLRSFFTEEEFIKEEVELAVAFEAGKWVVTGDLFGLPEASDEEEEE